MKFYTEQEIMDKVEKIYSKSYDFYVAAPADVKVVVYRDSIGITLSAMYGAPSLNLPILMEFAEFFETKNINDDDRFNRSGCETCDYGSEYGFTLTVRPEKG